MLHSPHGKAMWHDHTAADNDAGKWPDRIATKNRRMSERGPEKEERDNYPRDKLQQA